MTIQMKAIEQYFHVVPFITLYKVILAFRSVNETLKCGHSNERGRLPYEKVGDARSLP